MKKNFRLNYCMSYLMTRPIYSWTLKGSLYQWWQPQNFWSLLNLHSNLIILITGIYNSSNKESTIFKYYWFWNAENLFLSFLFFFHSLYKPKKIGLNPKMYFAFILFCESRANGYTFKFIFFFFQSLIHTPIIKWFLA